MQARTEQGPGGSDRDASALDGSVLRTRLDVLPGRPVPRLRCSWSAARPTRSRSSSARSCSRPAGRCRAGWRGTSGGRPKPAGARRGGPPIVQSAGTLFFNVTTYQAMHVALTSSDYDRLVWRPDWRGSICFLVSGAIAYVASPRRGRLGWLPARGGDGLVAAGRQPARLHLLRHLGRRGLRRAVDRLDASTSPQPTGTRRWARRASSPVRSTPCIPGEPRSCRCARELRELEHVLERDLQRLT